MTNPKVSVIVPCYNQEKYLGETLDSVIAQTYKNWECIIINDGSIDNSESIAKEYVRKDSRFKYIYQDNQGVVSARNNAIKQSYGKYILPLDGDDLISEDYLRRAVEILDNDQEVCFVYSDVENFGAKNGIWYAPEINRRNILYNGCCACSCLFRRSTFDHVGGYKQEMRKGWEDWEFFISLIEAGGNAHKIHEPMLKYRILDNSRERSIDEETKRELRSNIVKLHPQLFYEQYDQLRNDYFAIVESSRYKLFKIVDNIYLRARHFIFR